MRLIEAHLGRDASKSRPSRRNPFVLQVKFEIETPADVEQVAVLMRAIKDRRQDIQIGVK